MTLETLRLETRPILSRFFQVCNRGLLISLWVLISSSRSRGHVTFKAA